MRNLISITLVCSLACVGCMMPDEILVSNAFTPEEEEKVQAALDEWEEALDTDTGIELYFGWRPVFKFSEKTFNSEGDKATMHIVEKYSHAYQSVAFKYDEDFNGYTKYNFDWSIVVVRQNNPDHSPEKQDLRFTHTLLHEFGHYLGGGKHYDGTLMESAIKTPYDCIDQATVDRMCGLQWDCGPGAGTTCD